MDSLLILKRSVQNKIIKNLLSYIDFYSDSELDVLRAKKFWPIFFLLARLRFLPTGESIWASSASFQLFLLDVLS